MLQRAFAMLLAIGMMLFCAVRVSAQELLTLPSGGLHRISADELETRLGRFDAITVTLPPAPDTGVLYLDGAPLPAYRPLTRAQAGRIMLFSTRRAGTVSIGVTPLGGSAPQKKPRIHCINRRI